MESNGDAMYRRLEGDDSANEVEGVCEINIEMLSIVCGAVNFYL